MSASVVVSNKVWLVSLYTGGGGEGKMRTVSWIVPVWVMRVMCGMDIEV